MSDADATVYVVDDDPSVREALEGLLRSAGWNVAAFASARAFHVTSKQSVSSAWRRTRLGGTRAPKPSPRTCTGI